MKEATWTAPPHINVAGANCQENGGPERMFEEYPCVLVWVSLDAIRAP